MSAKSANHRVHRGAQRTHGFNLGLVKWPPAARSKFIVCDVLIIRQGVKDWIAMGAKCGDCGQAHSWQRSWCGRHADRRVRATVASPRWHGVALQGNSKSARLGFSMSANAFHENAGLCQVKLWRLDVVAVVVAFPKIHLPS